MKNKNQKPKKKHKTNKYHHHSVHSPTLTCSHQTDNISRDCLQAGGIGMMASKICGNGRIAYNLQNVF